jgi:hypothetical protein
MSAGRTLAPSPQATASTLKHASTQHDNHFEQLRIFDSSGDFERAPGVRG